MNQNASDTMVLAAVLAKLIISKPERCKVEIDIYTVFTTWKLRECSYTQSYLNTGRVPSYFLPLLIQLWKISTCRKLLGSPIEK